MEKHAMGVILKSINRENFEAVIALELATSQRDYVACNLYSIAESSVHPTYQPRAIYCDGEVVGFLMYESFHHDDQPPAYNIFRLMVDRRYQGSGIGHRAMQCVLEEIRAHGPFERILICYVSTNQVAREFYASLGFQEIGMSEATGEAIAEIQG
ncbi:MAG: N-acetyltransferase family protein [Pseudomonadota bacterium]